MVMVAATAEPTSLRSQIEDHDVLGETEAADFTACFAVDEFPCGRFEAIRRVKVCTRQGIVGGDRSSAASPSSNIRRALMKTLLKKVSLIAVALTLACFTPNGYAVAEKREMTFVKIGGKTITKSVFILDAALKHEIAQVVALSHPKFSDPDFKVKEEWSYVQSDTINGTGTDRGYFVEIHENGSQTYGTFQSTSETSTRPDGSWEATFEGTYRYAGGSGKYKNIKGGGTFKGKSSSLDPVERSEGREFIEY
jgi:hypothetical protein